MVTQSFLTFNNFFPLVLKPCIQSGPFIGLHGCALVEVLREVTLVQPCAFYNLPLRNVVLLHVHFDQLGCLPWVHSKGTVMLFSAQHLNDDRPFMRVLRM